jgi:hypothetical protein
MRGRGVLASTFQALAPDSHLILYSAKFFVFLFCNTLPCKTMLLCTIEKKPTNERKQNTALTFASLNSGLIIKNMYAFINLHQFHYVKLLSLQRKSNVSERVIKKKFF